MQPVAQRRFHQRVVARVELHLVDAPAARVVRMQHRAVRIGQARVLLHGGAADLGAQPVEPGAVVRRVVVGHRILQRPIATVQVHVDQRFGLIEHVVGGGHRAASLSISMWGMSSSR